MSSDKINSKPTVPARRHLLKALSAGGAAAVVVPSEWAKPALNAVLLPGHAQATGGGGGGGGGGGANSGCNQFRVWVFSEAQPTNGSCMSLNGSVDNTCGETFGVARVFNSSGQQVFQCQVNNGGFSFSCSACFAQGQSGPGVIQQGEQATVVAEFDGGCTCTTVTTARKE